MQVHSVTTTAAARRILPATAPFRAISSGDQFPSLTNFSRRLVGRCRALLVN